MCVGLDLYCICMYVSLPFEIEYVKPSNKLYTLYLCSLYDDDDARMTRAKKTLLNGDVAKRTTPNTRHCNKAQYVSPEQ